MDSTTHGSEPVNTEFTYVLNSVEVRELRSFLSGGNGRKGNFIVTAKDRTLSFGNTIKLEFYDNADERGR